MFTAEEDELLRLIKNGEEYDKKRVTTKFMVKMCSDCKFCVMNGGNCYMIDNNKDNVCRNHESKSQINVQKLLNSKRVRVSYLNATEANGAMLNTIMDNNNLTVCAMANIFGVRESTMEHWLSGRDIPNAAKMLIVLIFQHPETINLIRKTEYIQGEIQ